MIYNIPVIILIILLLYQILGKTCYEFFTLTRIRSTVDNNVYPVVSKYPDSEKAADMIAQMNIFAINLINKLKQRYINVSDTEFKNTKEYKKGNHITRVLLKRFSTGSFQENEPDSPDNTSYTTNKGEIISLCIREKQSGKNEFHDITVLQFVLIHELAHIITKEMDHVTSFWTNFKFLLEFCHKNYLYKSKNYHEENSVYCGMNISYNPIHDKTLTSYFT